MCDAGDDRDDACCAPSRGPASARDITPEPAASAPHRAETALSKGMVTLPGGRFLMGTDDAIGYVTDGEGPIREISLRPFSIDAAAVTNVEFAAFVDATGHVTDAERFGWSFVFGGLLPDDFPETSGVASAPWWRQVLSAYWRRPEGAQSDDEGRLDHPVVHVSHRDALAYCAWASKRLATEAEWEYAARGGLEQRRYPWGDDLTPGGEHQCNIWQGAFPAENTVDDGYYGTAPARSYPPNAFGLYNVAGNVWEWCADWFSPDFHGTGARDNPVGPPMGTHRVIRGGSYLCHESYCFRYRVAARSANSPDSSTGNTGFRCVRDLDNVRAR